jgi:hypothetical protein
MQAVRHLTLAVVLAALACGAAGADASARAEKGDGPTAIAVGFGSLWVGTGGGVVMRLDPETAKVQARFRDVGFVHGLRVGFGSVWALGDEVVRIDPVRNRARYLPETSSATTFTLAVGANSVWVADDGRDVVDRVDPQRTRRSAVVRVPGRAFGLAAGGDHVIVVSVPTSGSVNGPHSRRLLRRVDPRTNRASPPLARLECDPGIAITPRAVWTTDPCHGLLERRDPRTLQVLERRRTARWLNPVAAFGSLWLVGHRSVVRRDLDTLRVQARVRAGGATTAVGDGALWTLDDWGGSDARIRRIDPRTNRVTATLRLPPTS